MTTQRFLLSLSLLMLTAVLGPRHDARGQSKEQTVEQLATRAEIVAVGTVADLRPEWNADRTRISTQVTLRVDQYLKGNVTENTLTLTVPGGEVDDVGETYSHVARFTNNERVVVFADRDARGGYRVTAGDQGKLTVSEDRSTGKQVVTEGLSLDILKARVRNAVRLKEQR